MKIRRRNLRGYIRIIPNKKYIYIYIFVKYQVNRKILKRKKNGGQIIEIFILKVPCKYPYLKRKEK